MPSVFEVLEHERMTPKPICETSEPKGNPSKKEYPKKNAEALRPLLQKLRNLAMQQPGYISGETFKRIDRPGESLVVSTWQSMEDWREWVVNDIRKGTQEKIDHLLGEKTEYEIYSYD